MSALRFRARRFQPEPLHITLATSSKVIVVMANIRLSHRCASPRRHLAAMCNRDPVIATIHAMSRTRNRTYLPVRRMRVALQLQVVAMALL
ncbi:hypothetical protein DBV39_06560 [Orrella marina]|uniref:Uncharacterized protein n=1 Tax=Orrella marina TaxID=2163011 RepID=A0A2R4XI25_9BURK|nr:hypothetical protein DBV39_06560 [Orrella marina]